MNINKLSLLCWVLIFFIFPLASFAASDSTSPDIIPPPVTRQCFTVRAGTSFLNPTPQPVKANGITSNCTWRGRNHAGQWAGAVGVGVSDATYDQSCDQNEVAVGFKLGMRGVINGPIIYGEYDIYVNCCKLEISITMSQSWAPCPTIPR